MHIHACAHHNHKNAYIHRRTLAPRLALLGMDIDGRVAPFFGPQATSRLSSWMGSRFGHVARLYKQDTLKQPPVIPTDGRYQKGGIVFVARLQGW